MVGLLGEGVNGQLLFLVHLMTEDLTWPHFLWHRACRARLDMKHSVIKAISCFILTAT